MKGSFALAVLAALLVAGSASGGTARKPWLWQCTQIHNADPQYRRCYVRLLRLDIERSGDPARELPHRQARARRTLAVVTNGGFPCAALARGRDACETGAAQMRAAFVTFS